MLETIPELGPVSSRSRAFSVIEGLWHESTAQYHTGPAASSAWRSGNLGDVDRPRYIVYGLVDPRNGELRYVGKSVCGFGRPCRHAWPSYLCRDHTHKGYWIRQLLRDGLMYEVEVLEVLAHPMELPEAEMFWIAYMRFVGCRLTNTTAGGEGTWGTRKSAETRRRMSIARGGAEAKRAEAVFLYSGGLSTRDVARRLGIGHKTVFHFVKDAGALRSRSLAVKMARAA